MGFGSPSVCGMGCGGEAAVSVLVWFLSSGPLANPQLHFLTNSIKSYLTEAQENPGGLGKV